MEQLFEIHNRLLKSVKIEFKRSLYSKIDYKQRLIEIKGARGVGKTTLMLQIAKELQAQKKSVLYFSADTPYFYKNNLFDTADNFYKYGGQILFIDEIHKYPQKHKKIDWASELKNIYDAFPDLQIIYSGSSILQLYKSVGDLSRRKTTYFLPGLSFREYLIYNNKIKIDAISLNNILSSHTNLCNQITSKIKILLEFNKYLKTGYYPFYNENPLDYYQRLSEIINVIIETDIPFVSEITNETSHKIKQLLAVVASSTPYTPNLSNIASKLYITDQRTLIKYLNLLEKAELITTLSAKTIGNTIMNKPEKMYLNNSNIMFAIDKLSVNTGTIRETFFLNQLKYEHKINYSKQADFIIDNKYTFEVGGKNKKSKQIKDIENAYIVKDDIEIGFGNKIPLWLFGFLY